MRAALVVLLLIGVARADDVVGKAAEPRGEIPRVRTIEAEKQAGALEGGPRAVAFSPDGKLLAQGAVDGGVSVARVEEGSWHRVSEHSGAVAGVAFLERANGLVLVSAGDDGTLRVVTLDALAAVSSAARPLGLGPLTALAVLDGERVVAGSGRGALAVVKVGDALSIEKTFERHEGAVAALVVAGRRVFSAGWDGFVRVSDPATGKEVRAAKVSSVELTCAAASPDGKALAVGSWRKGVVLLDAATLKTLATLEPHRGAATGLLLAGKGGLDKARLVSASLADEMLALSAPLGPKLALEGVKRTRIFAVPSGGLAVSPDGTLVACAAADGSVGIFRIE